MHWLIYVFSWFPIYHPARMFVYVIIVPIAEVINILTLSELLQEKIVFRSYGFGSRLVLTVPWVFCSMQCSSVSMAAL